MPQVCGGNISGMFGFFFYEGPVTCFADATKSDTEKFAKWHRMMLQKAPGQPAGSKIVLKGKKWKVRWKLVSRGSVI